MARVLAAVLLLGLLSTNAGSDDTTPPPKGAPELLVSLAPAQGYVPLDEADHLPYRFSVSALDPETRGQYGYSDVLVRPGQRRDLKGRTIRGSVHLREDGSASYRAELVIDGRVVARTRATVRVKTPS